MLFCKWLFVSASVLAYAQDPFEIQVFEYDPLPRGAFTYEAHINDVVAGLETSPGQGVAPWHDQFHLSSEVTAGLNDAVRIGVTALTAMVPGYGPEYAGIRILPHFYAPKSWNLPLNLGFVVEFSFEHPLFNENTREVELRGILEKHLGRLELDSNYVMAHALRGPGTSEGWEFEPSGRVGWRLSSVITPSLEYYGSLGPVDNVLPIYRQAHLLFPGADWRPREGVTWSFGIGVGLTDERLVFKSRIEFEFGRKRD